MARDAAEKVRDFNERLVREKLQEMGRIAMYLDEHMQVAFEVENQ